MIIMTLSAHDLIASCGGMIVMRKSQQNLCKITKKRNGIWWYRWNDNNFCYCLFFRNEAFHFSSNFCMRWYSKPEMEKEREKDERIARHGIEFKLQSMCAICISGNSHHDRWLCSRRQLSLVTTNNKLQNERLFSHLVSHTCNHFHMYKHIW